MSFVVWLDTALGPPWSGLALLGIIATLQALGLWVTWETFKWLGDRQKRKQLP